jgi:RHS repeat-associated protein
VDDSGFRLAYRYDAFGRLVTVTDSESVAQVKYDYDINGKVATKTLGNGVLTVYSYDANGNVLEIVNKAPDASTLSRFAYTYDSRGLRSTMTTEAGTWNYIYDDAGQLVKWTAPDGRSEAYTYDALGNRITLVDDRGRTEVYTTNKLNQYTAVTGHGSFTYDADGNLIRQEDGSGVTTYSYDAENNLVGIQSGASTRAYVYDAFGQLVAATRDGKTNRYQIDPIGYGNVVAEYGDANQLVARNVHAGGLISRSAAGTAGYYTFDAIGNTIEMTGATGNALNRYVYTPFGESLVSQEAVGNPFQFNGEHGIYLELNSLSVMRARFYDSTRGRFVEQDPIGIASDVNMYRYSFNSVVSLNDPSGLQSSMPGFNPNGRGYNFGEAMERYGEWRKKLDRIHKDPIIVHAVHCTGPDSGEDWLLSDQYGQGYIDHCRPPPPPPPRRQPIQEPPPPPPPPHDGLYYPPVAGVVSVDPNELTGPSGYGDQRFVRPDVSLGYRVDFENYESATAPAQLVDISNPIAADLDLATLQFGSVGWGDTLISIPAGRNFFRTVVPMTYKGFTFDVEVSLGIRQETRTVWAQFLSFDPATSLPPDALIGFLPPEDGSGRGMGFFTYTVKARSDVASGTVVRNVALITFDRGETIATNQIDPHDPSKGTDPAKEAFVTFDSTVPSSAVSPLPAATGTEAFPVAWSGSDGTGSGAGLFSVYVATDGGAWTPWMIGTTLREAVFEGVAGKSYAFYAVATDNVGNKEEKVPLVEAQTRVSANATPVLAEIAPVSVKEGDLLDFIVGATDADAGQKLTFTLEGDVPFGMAIAPATGRLTWRAASGPAAYEPVVRVTDDGDPARSVTRTFSVAVTNVSPRVQISGKTEAVLGAAWSAVGTWDDPGTQTWTGTINFGDGTGTQQLALNPADRRIQLTHTFAALGNYSVLVTLADSSGGSVAASLPVLVTAGSFAPTSVTVKAIASALPENTSTRTRVKVADIAISDDAFGVNTLTLSGADASRFEIDPVAARLSATLYLRAGVTLDYELKSVYAVTVTAADESIPGARPVSADFVLVVGDVNEGPTALLLSNTTAPENLSAGALVGALSAVDPDAKEDFTYSLVKGAGDSGNAAFVIDGASLRTAAPLDYEARSSYPVRVRATDRGGLFVEKELVVTVTNVAEAPSAVLEVVGMPGDAKVSLSWKAPVSTGDSPIDAYFVESSRDGGKTWTAFLQPTTNSLAATVSGLTNGTAFIFRVTALNAVGRGIASIPSAAVTPSPYPGMPTALGVQRGAGRVSLTWGAPAAVGRSAITNYVVQLSTNNGATWTTVKRSVSTATSAVITGLVNGTPYVFRVAAMNAAGSGPATDKSAVVAPATVPVVASGLTATRGNGQVSLAWKVPVSNGGSTITDYVVQSSTDGGKTWKTFTDGVSTASKAVVTGLANGTPSVFRVAALNDVGVGAYTTATAPVTPATVPGAAGNLTATRGNGQVSLAWKAPPSNGGSVITDYLVQSSSDGGKTWKTVPDGLSVAAGAVVKGLANGTSYLFRVAAVNSVGPGDFTMTTSAVTPATVPGAATGLTATRGNGQVSLSWQSPSANGGSVITDYVIQSSIDSGKTWRVFADGITTATSAIVTGLANGTGFVFRVASVNDVGSGAFTAPTSSVVPATEPGQVTGLTATRGSGQVLLAWQGPSSNGGSQITGSTIDFSSDGGVTWKAFAHTASIATKATITGLADSTSYVFRVAARNAVGRGVFALVESAAR